MTKTEPTARVMPHYRYQAATLGGVFQSGPSSIDHAKRVMIAHRDRYPNIEVERVLELPGNGRRYWRWRSGKWTTDITSDPTPADLARWKDARS